MSPINGGPPHYDEILQELENATRSLHSLDLETPARHRAVLDRRSTAVRAIALFCSEHLPELPEEQRTEFLERLNRVRETGELAAARLNALRRNAAGEWGRWNQVLRALEASAPAGPARINCKG